MTFPQHPVRLVWHMRKTYICFRAVLPNGKPRLVWNWNGHCSKWQGSLFASCHNLHPFIWCWIYTRWVMCHGLDDEKTSGQTTKATGVSIASRPHGEGCIRPPSSFGCQPSFHQSQGLASLDANRDRCPPRCWFQVRSAAANFAKCRIQAWHAGRSWDDFPRSDWDPKPAIGQVEEQRMAKDMAPRL